MAKTSRKISATFFALIVLQAAHSTEEFIFGFYERFPPMRFVYQNDPHLAPYAFAMSNLLLVLVGLICFYYWVWPARKGTKVIVWIWIVIESLNVLAHFVWAALIRDYNPGLVTGILFVPLIVYLTYLMGRTRSPAIKE
jgi:hypothetical protein